MARACCAMPLASASGQQVACRAVGANSGAHAWAGAERAQHIRPLSLPAALCARAVLLALAAGAARLCQGRQEGERERERWREREGEREREREKESRQVGRKELVTLIRTPSKQRRTRISPVCYGGVTGHHHRNEEACSRSNSDGSSGALRMLCRACWLAAGTYGSGTCNAMREHYQALRSMPAA